MADEKRQTFLQRSLNSLLEKRIRLLKEEMKQQEALHRSTTQQLRDIERLEKTQAKTNDVFERGEQLIKRYAASLTAAALAHRAYSIATSSASKETKRFLASAQPLDEVSTSFREIGRRAREYQEIVKEDIKLAQIYGMEREEVRGISDEWINALRFVDGYTEESRDRINALSRATIIASRVLGKDYRQIIEQATRRMFQFGESAEEATDKLIRVRSNTEILNKTVSEFLDEQAAYMWADDFAAVVDEAATSTKGFVQDLDLLTAAMAASAESALKAELSYNQALGAARAMGKFLAAGDEGAITTTLGLRLLERMKEARGPGGELSEAFLQDFNEAQRQELIKISEMVGVINEQDIALILADSLSMSKIGLEENLKLWYELGAASGDIVPILMQQRNMTRAEAFELARQLHTAESYEEVLANITEQMEGAAERTQETKLNALNVIRAEGGKAGIHPWVDEQWVRLDEVIGSIKAHFADLGNVSKWALGSAVIGSLTLFRSLGMVRGGLGKLIGGMRSITGMIPALGKLTPGGVLKAGTQAARRALTIPKVGVLGAGGQAAAKGAATRGTASAVGGTLARSAGVGVLSAASMATLPFEAMYRLTEYSTNEYNYLKRVHFASGRPLDERTLGSSYRQYVLWLANNPRQAQRLIENGYIAQSMLSDIAAAQSPASLPTPTAPAPAVAAATRRPAPSQEPHSTAGAAAASLGMGRGRFSQINADGSAIIDVRFRVEDAMAPAARYDQLKENFRP